MSFRRFFLYGATLRVAAYMSGADESKMDSRSGNGQKRILVIGKSGNGKSSVCNMLVGRRCFDVGRGMATTTRTMQSESAFGSLVQVVDTPDVTNCPMSQREMQAEVDRWRKATLPFPTAVLLTVRCDVRYTAEEHAIYREIQKLWGDNTLQHRLIVAFTYGDLQDNPIEEELKTVCPELQSVLKDAGRRYVVFNNKASNRDFQVQRLMTLVDSLPPTAAPGSPDWYRYLPTALMGAMLVSGFSLFTSVSANHNSMAWVFGFLFVAAGLGLIALKMKDKTN